MCVRRASGCISIGRCVLEGPVVGIEIYMLEGPGGCVGTGRCVLEGPVDSVGTGRCVLEGPGVVLVQDDVCWKGQWTVLV